MGKIFINKNGKTHVHTLSTEKKSSTNSDNDYRLSFLQGDKIVFDENFQDINYGDYMFNACNVEVIKGTLNVQNTANYMFSGDLVCYSAMNSPKTRLKEVDIKCTTTNAKDMFSYNTNLETVKLELPNAISCENIFYSCPNLRHVDIQAPNATTLDGAFRNCYSLEHIDISSLVSCTSYKNLFVSCTNLVSVTLPTLTSGSKAGMFQGCSSLQNVEINLQGTVSGFNSSTFSNCSSIHTISGDWSKITTICGGAADNYKIFDDCTALRNFNADISGVAIGDELFYNCVSLENFTSSLASLTSGLKMFLRCKLNLQSVTNIINSLMTENTNGGTRLTLGVDKNIKNDVITYLVSKGANFTGDDGTNTDTTFITNAAGNSWVLDINWN